MRIIHGEQMTLVFFSLAAGSEVPEHGHPHEQIGTVLQGTVAMKIGPEKKIVNAGEAYHIPPNVLHSGKVLDQPAEVLEIFSPVREDLKPD
jgi:quercetin dioxygenase-like cupin family protein